MSRTITFVEYDPEFKDHNLLNKIAGRFESRFNKVKINENENEYVVYDSFNDRGLRLTKDDGIVKEIYNHKINLDEFEDIPLVEFEVKVNEKGVMKSVNKEYAIKFVGLEECDCLDASFHIFDTLYLYHRNKLIKSEKYFTLIGGFMATRSDECFCCFFNCNRKRYLSNDNSGHHNLSIALNNLEI